MKNSEVKDSFKAKGLKEANDVLDIMRLPANVQYGYNRYLDSLHLKASELFSLQSEAEYNIKFEIAKKAILNNADNYFISTITGLSIEIIEQLRSEIQAN